jgi:N-acetylglucosamine kinase-like BadF-type ATPase
VSAQQPARSPYALGVDGGGTKCYAVLVHRERGVIGTGRAGSCNPQSAGRERAVQALTDAIAAACAALPPGVPLDRVAVGLAGLDTPCGVAEGTALVQDALRLAGVEAAQVLAENDGLIALRGAAAGGRGLLLVAGTGSIAYATDGARFVRAGGWGHRVGDEGSAHQIVQRALAAAFRSFDGLLPRTELPGYLCRAAGVPDMYELYEWLYRPGVGVDAIAALAPAVDQAAADGDPVAAAILEEAGQSLAGLAGATARQAGLLDGRPFPVFLVGGVLQHSTRVRESLLEALKANCPTAVPEMPRHQPVLGAVLLALGGPEAVGEELRQALLGAEALQAPFPS